MLVDPFPVPIAPVPRFSFKVLPMYDSAPATASIAEAVSSEKLYTKFSIFRKNPVLGKILDEVLDVVADELRETDDEDSLIGKIVDVLDRIVDARNNMITETYDYAPEDFEGQ